MCVRAVRATYLISLIVQYLASKEVWPFLLHIHITLLVARKINEYQRISKVIQGEI